MDNNTSDFTEFSQFNDDIFLAWKYLLISASNKIQRTILNKLNKDINPPNFHINPNLNAKWGEWNPTSRTITLSLKLLRNYEWNAVEYVLKHEFAHLIVDEIFNIEHEPHGELFKKACLILDIPDNVTSSHDFLSSFKGGSISPIIDKIRKLLNKGNDNRNISQEESQLFLNKAHELLLKHNISASAVLGNSNSNSFFTIRPVGFLMKSPKDWINEICRILQDNYNVNYIWTYALSKDGKYQRRIELFGTVDNLDVAEYVFHALLTQAEILWNNYKNSHQDKLKSDPTYKASMGISYNGNTKRISKNSFLFGVMNAYKNKLATQNYTIMDTISPEDQAIIQSNDGILEEAFNKKYKVRNIKTGSFSRSSSYFHGREKGSSLTLAQAVKASPNRHLSLNA